MHDRYGLSGKTAVVTGATAGIGGAVAHGLSAAGAHVVAVGRDRQRGEALCDRISAEGGSVEFVSADVGEQSGLDDVLDVARARPVDILVNNAGTAILGPTEALTPTDFDKMIATNIRGAFFLVAGIAPGMAERGSGSIVNVSSMAGAVGTPGAAVYGATKSALESLTRSWAAEYSARGVRINSVAPGPTYTAAAPRDWFDTVGLTTAMQRAAEPTEIGEMILFLSSERASYVTGSTFPVDGGRTAI